MARKKIIFIIVISILSALKITLAQDISNGRILIEYRGDESDKRIYPIVIVKSKDSVYYTKHRSNPDSFLYDSFFYDSLSFNKVKGFIENSFGEHIKSNDQMGHNRYSFIVTIYSGNICTYYFFDSKKKSIDFFWKLALMINDWMDTKQNRYLLHCLENKIVRMVGYKTYIKKYNRFYSSVTCF